jgi:hypothetical protein
MHIFLAAVKREVPAQFPWGSKWLKERTSCPTLNEKRNTSQFLPKFLQLKAQTPKV